MTTNALKKSIIKKVETINDDELLKELNGMLDNAEAIYKLNEEEKKLIAEGDADLENGNWLTHQQMLIEIEKWRGK